MDGAESSSESEVEEDDQSEEETNIKVHFFKSQPVNKKKMTSRWFSINGPCTLLS